jgi:acyl-CoA dehydrogenase
VSERSLLADAVATFFGERCMPEDVSRVEAGADARPLWSEMEELGLTLVGVPEEAGGGGGSLVDALTVLRSAGRHAVPLPLAETSVLAGWALADAGLAILAGPTTIAPVRADDHLRIAVRGDARLDGRALRVPWAAGAEPVVAVAEDEQGAPFVAVLAPDLVEIAPGASLAGEPRDTVTFRNVRVEPECFAPLSVNRDMLFLRGALARSVQMLGALERTRDITVAFSKDRAQFGRPISSFQAVQHMLAQIARDVAVVRSAVELAVSAAVDGVADAWLEIAAAKVLAGRAAGAVTAQAHQVHGAMGVAKEYHLSILTRRLWCWRDEFGTESEWSLRIGEAAWAAPSGVWELVTAGRLPLDPVRTA